MHSKTFENIQGSLFLNFCFIEFVELKFLHLLRTMFSSKRFVLTFANLFDGSVVVWIRKVRQWTMIAFNGICPLWKIRISSETCSRQSLAIYSSQLSDSDKARFSSLFSEIITLWHVLTRRRYPKLLWHFYRSFSDTHLALKVTPLLRVIRKTFIGNIW